MLSAAGSVIRRWNGATLITPGRLTGSTLSLTPCGEREDMMPSWPGEYRYDPCDRCGYATRFKQFPMVCACTTPDRCPHPPIYVRGNNICQRCGGDPRVPRENMHRLREHIEEIQAEQADLQARATPPSGPPLRVADRYADGRPRRR